MRKAQTNKGKILKRSEGKYKAVSQRSSKRSSVVRNRLREEAFLSFSVYVPRLALRFTSAGVFRAFTCRPNDSTIKDVPVMQRGRGREEARELFANYVVIIRIFETSKRLAGN